MRLTEQNILHKAHDVIKLEMFDCMLVYLHEGLRDTCLKVSCTDTKNWLHYEITIWYVQIIHEMSYNMKHLLLYEKGKGIKNMPEDKLIDTIRSMISAGLKYRYGIDIKNILITSIELCDKENNQVIY